MLKLKRKSSFKKDLKRYQHDKKLLDELEKVISLLVDEQPLPQKYRNHQLSGKYIGVMELHLRPDDLLMYIKIEKESITLVAIGSDSYLFN